MTGENGRQISVGGLLCDATGSSFKKAFVCVVCHRSSNHYYVCAALIRDSKRLPFAFDEFFSPCQKKCYNIYKSIKQSCIRSFPFGKPSGMCRAARCKTLAFCP
jgi:hypothetical protein